MKYLIKCPCIILIIFCFFFEKVDGQKVFDVTIRFTDTTDLSRIGFQYDDGLQQELNVKPIKLNAYSFKIKHKFYSRYATIFIVLHKKDGRVLTYNYFWVTDTPAVISYKNKLTAITALDTPITSHAYELKNKKIVKELDKFYSIQQHTVDSLLPKYLATQEKDTVIGHEYGKATLALRYRQMDFITSHPNSYYCFWLFQRETRFHFFSPDTLFKIFNTVFPQKFQLTSEGQRIKNLLMDKIRVDNKYAYDFVAKDIQGNTISLKDFRNKYVLLHFWAPWCVPCIAEMPEIEEIRNTFPRENLKIISVCLKSNITQCKKDIKKYDMNWTNIYYNKDIINKYFVAGIPQLYLIDKTGRIVYVADDLNAGTYDKGLKRLWSLLYLKLGKE